MSEPTDVIEKYADKLVKVMGDIAPEAWEIMVRGQIVEGIHDLIFTAVWVAVSVGALMLGRQILKEKWEEDMERPAAALLGFIALFAFFIAMNFLSDGIMSLAAPEYQAIKELMQ